MSIRIFYDGECPFCARYVRLLRLRAAAGPVTLVNLREHDGLRHDLERAGFDLDEGMVVETGGRQLGGADAVHALALLSTGAGLFNRLNGLVLGSRHLAFLLYPVMRSGRWLALFLLGRPAIAADDPAITARASIFASFFALFSIFHVFNYALEYQRFPPEPDQIAILLAALLLFFRPHSPRALFLLMALSTLSTILQAPVQSNHTMVRSMALLGYWAAFVLALARARSWSGLLAGFAPAGQGALLVMYGFGIFHKLNTDFLDPETSCAVALWSLMPAPLAALEGPLMDRTAILGTFFVEGSIIVALLVPRWRHLGIVAGILFHLLLALSGYAMYISFTMLAIALHTLFLNGEAASRIMASRTMAAIARRRGDPAYIAAALALLVLLALSAASRNYTLSTLLVLPIVLPFCALVILHGRSSAPLLARGPGLAIGACVTALFIANNLMPYAGLKTAQTIAMFANLRLEAGVSNHLVFSRPPGPFGYLEDVALILDPGTSRELAWYRSRGFGIVYYDLLARLADDPSLTVSFEMHGTVMRDARAATLAREIAAILHPPWVRKVFHFQPVELARPEPCNV